MISYLNELYAHQAWADAEHWRAFEAHPAALADKAIRERLLHIHQVQYAFLWITGPRTSGFEFKKLEDFSSMAAITVRTYGSSSTTRIRSEAIYFILPEIDQNQIERVKISVGS